jgi:PAS domain S-box-containing protein
MKTPFKILWVKEATSTTLKGMTLLENEYKVSPTFVEETAAFLEALEQSKFDFILIQLPVSYLYKGTIMRVLKDALVKTPCIVIEISTNRDKIDWIKAGAKDGIFAHEIELLPILVERQMTINTQQAERELALNRKEIEYVALFHNSLEAILIHDFNKITQVNAAFLFQLGYLNEEELIGRSPLETLVYPEDIALLNLTEVAQNLEAITIVPNIRLLKKDTTLLKCDLRIVSMHCGGAWCSQIILQEIANKKSIKAYLEAKEQSQMLLHHAEQVPGMIYQFQGFPDNSYCFPFVSNSVYKTHGITAQELMEDGTRYFEYMPEEDIMRFMQAGAISMKTLKNWNLDYRLVIPGRGIRWMRGTSTPVRLPDGSILWSGYIADITADKIASAALKDREEQVRTIFKHAPDAIVVLKTDSTIVEWNPKAVAIFGWTEEEAVGQLLYNLIAPKRKYYKYEQSLERYKNNGDGITLNQALEVRAVRKSGEEFSITMALSEMTLKNTQFFIGFISDITKRKNAAEKLKESLLEKEVLLKEIHHRVKNNMQVITSLLSLQSSFIEDDTVKEIFRNSQYRINSMGMVHEMLYQSEDISKINYGSYLKRLIERLIRAMRGENSLIQLKLEVPNVSLNIDTAIPLSLIVNELVTNSLKYAFPNEQNGTICVKLSCLEYPNFQLDIGDDGIGFFEEDILKTTKSLGLMLVGRLSMQLKGSIQHLETPEGTHYELLFQELSQY